MPGTFYVTGLIVSSNTGRSYRVLALDNTGNKVFIGLVSRKALSSLLQKITLQADICQFSQTAAQEPLNFNVELKP